MKALIIVFIISGYTQLLQAQAGISLDVNEPATSNGYGMVRFSNAAAQTSKTVDDIDLSEVAGSPYYDNAWHIGIVILVDNKAVKIPKVKLNLSNNELHYIDTTGKEMVVADVNVKRVFLMDSKDTSKVYALFQVIQGYQGKAGGTYMQVLNQGILQLLKLNEIKIFKKDYDVLAGKNIYSFKDNIRYFFLKNNNLLPCKSLNKADIFTAILPDAAANTWLNDNKNKLKSEKDVVSFLAYYNTK